MTEGIILVLPHYLLEDGKHYLTYDYNENGIKYEYSRQEFKSKEEIEEYLSKEIGASTRISE